MWWPWNVPSRITSRHHWSMVSKRSRSPKVIKTTELKWNQIAKPEVIRRAPIAPVRGQGLGSTMWYACA